LWESEARKAAVLDAALDAVIIADHAGRVLEFNRAAERVFGWSREDVVGRDVAGLFVPPRLRGRHAEGMAHYLATGEGRLLGRRSELSALRADGTEFPCEVVITRIVTTGPPAFAATVRDLSWWKQAVAALRESDQRFRLLADSAPVLLWLSGPDGQATYFNRGWLEFTGRALDEEAGDGWTEGVHPDDLPGYRRACDDARRGRRSLRAEFRLRRADGVYRWVLATSVPHLYPDGSFAGHVGSAVDITYRRDAEQAQLRRGRQLEFLSQASAVLASSLDYETTLASVARLAVPQVADWCGVDLVRDDRTIYPVAVAHVDPAKVELAHQLRRRYPPDPDDTRGVPGVLRSGRSRLVPTISDEMLGASIRDPDQLRLLRQLGLRSVMIVPLVARGRTLGAITLVTAESGRTYGHDDLALAEDLARRAALAVDNARLYQEAQEAARRKDQFLAMLAHELRNPLAPLLHGLHVLRLGSADPQQLNETRAIVDRQARHLGRMVDDLLEVSRITSGKVQLRQEVLHLAALVRTTALDRRGMLEQAGLRLELEVPPQPVWVVGDPTRLAQVLNNLLDNAVKFRGTGDRVQVRLETDALAGRAILVVRDFGMGIEPEELTRVFDVFAQADRTLDRARGGLGLGLAVVKGLVELHGGDVRAASAGLGRGAEFTIRLPLKEERAALSTSPVPPAAGPRLRRRVLVVEDSPDAAQTLRMVLEMMGHEVAVAHTGPEGVARAREWHPDTVLCDIGLPGLDGYGVARELRRGEETRDARLIAITGYGREEDRRRACQAGFDHHLTKPVDPADLDGVLSGAGNGRSPTGAPKA
jgi:PAS domain S-box-containing protein